MFNNLKVLFALTLIAFLYIETNANNYRCKQSKAYAFCGANTQIGTQWYFNTKRNKCLPYKYCIDSHEIEIPEDWMENRFENEIQCEYFCQNKIFIKSSKSRINSLSKLRLKKIKKTVSNHYEPRDALKIKKQSSIEIQDPRRCLRIKAYSFCGSKTSPQIHWYYSKRVNRCLPYTYCESNEGNSVPNLENNFFSEKECIKLCGK